MKKAFCILTALCALGAGGQLRAAGNSFSVSDTTLSTGTSPYSYDDTSIWTLTTTTSGTPGSPPTTVPNNQLNVSGSNYFYSPRIIHGSGAVELDTNGAVTVSDFVLQQTGTTSGQSTTLKLGGDYTIGGAGTAWQTTGGIVTNQDIIGLDNVVGTYGDTSKILFDLNGHNLTVSQNSYIGTNYASGVMNGSSSYTVKNTSATPGVYNLPKLNMTDHDLLEIGSNVTLRVTQNVNQGTTTVKFDTGSTFQIDNGATASGSYLTVATANPIYNFTLGGSNGAVTQYYTASSEATTNNMIIQNNVLLSKSGGVASNLTPYPGRRAAVYIGGNLTDQGGTGATSFGGNNGIFFNGGAGTERTVGLNRSQTNAIQVGDSVGATNGNIKLVNPDVSVAALTTSGSFTVLNGSRVNLGNSTATGSAASLVAGSIAINSGATVATILGAHAGFGSTSGALTLNSFNLQLDYDGSGWTNGAPLVLFGYGSLSGTPSATISSIASGYTITWGSLSEVGNQVILNGVNIVAIPEPSAALLIGAFGGLVVWTVRRKSRKSAV